MDIGELERNNKIQKAMIEIKNKYGKNAIVKGMDYRIGQLQWKEMSNRRT